MLAPAATQAAPKTYVANKVSDHAPNGCTKPDCTLREAVLAANAHSGRDTIDLQAKTYTLAIPGTHENESADGDLDVTDPVTIAGKGPTKTTLDGGGATVNDPAITFYANGRMTGITERNSVAANTVAGIVARENLTLVRARVLNNTQNNSSCCSGLETDGNLSLTRVVVANNSGLGQQAGVNVGGKATFSHVTVRGNHGGEGGSGVSTSPSSSARVLIEDTRILDNYGPETPVGCCNGLTLGGPGKATLRRVVISGNHGECCNGYVGGEGPAKLIDVVVKNNTGTNCCQGLYPYTGATTVKRVTVSGNDDSTGGCVGVCLTTSSVRLINSTVSGNHGAQDGAGISALSGASLFMSNVTATRNHAGADGGGLFANGTTPPTIQNSILAGNTVGDGGADCLGTIVSRGHNLIGDDTTCTITGTTAGNLLNVPAGLKPLRDNGGFTKTHALKGSSRALNHGSPKKPGSGGKACDRRDQRKVKRPQGPRCDIGAYERRKHRPH